MQKDSAKLMHYGIEFAKSILDVLSEMSDFKITKNHYFSCLSKIEELILTYYEVIPTHFVELLDFLQQLIYTKSQEDLASIEGHAFFNRTKLLCELMCKEPSIELYISLAMNEFECLYQYTDFSDEMLSTIMDYLISSNNPSLFNNIPFAFNEVISSDESKELLWLSFSKVPMSDELQIKAIENAKVTGENFLEFCKEMAVSASNKETVLSTLVKRVKNEDIYSIKDLNDEIKAVICYYIIFCAYPTVSVLREIIESINPSDNDYFNFFHMIIQDFCMKINPTDKKIILSSILNKINSDEPSKPEEVKIQIRRLRLFAYNL